MRSQGWIISSSVAKTQSNGFENQTRVGHIHSNARTPVRKAASDQILKEENIEIIDPHPNVQIRVWSGRLYCVQHSLMSTVGKMEPNLQLFNFPGRS